MLRSHHLKENYRWHLAFWEEFINGKMIARWVCLRIIYFCYTYTKKNISIHSLNKKKSFHKKKLNCIYLFLLNVCFSYPCFFLVIYTHNHSLCIIYSPLAVQFTAVYTLLKKKEKQTQRIYLPATYFIYLCRERRYIQSLYI